MFENRAQTSPQNLSPTAINKFAYIKMEGVLTGSTYVITSTIWISNYDGTGKVMVPITTVGVTGDQFTSCSLSPDGQTVFLLRQPKVAVRFIPVI